MAINIIPADFLRDDFNKYIGSLPINKPTQIRPVYFSDYSHLTAPTAGNTKMDQLAPPGEFASLLSKDYRLSSCL